MNLSSFIQVQVPVRVLKNSFWSLSWSLAKDSIFLKFESASLVADCDKFLVSVFLSFRCAPMLILR